jgi:hyperosmotically inducible protein
MFQKARTFQALGSISSGRGFEAAGDSDSPHRRYESLQTVPGAFTYEEVKALRQAPRRKKMKRNFTKMLGLTATLILTGVAGATAPTGPYTDAEIAAKAAHEIRMYSRYTIWDNINVRVNDGNLALIGQVSQPFKKQDLQRIAQRVPGVTSVTNQLEVLPLSFNDDNLRLRIARAIYRDPALSRYAIQAVPPIHIIVKNGHVTLEGVVNNDLEKTVATMRASSAGLSFGPVQNNLRVENPKKKS